MFKVTILMFAWLLACLRSVVVADPEGKPAEIKAEITRLGDPKLQDKTPAVKALIKIGGLALPPLIETLEDPGNDVRRLAAEAIREILEPDPTIAPNYHGEVHWKKLVRDLKVGMTVNEVLHQLFPGADPDERKKHLEGGLFGGGSGTQTCRLDDYWIMKFSVTSNQNRRYFLLEIPEPMRWVRRVRTPGVPRDFTGDWTTWFVHGRKSDESQFMNGKSHGASTTFYENGEKFIQHHNVMGVSQGTATGWYSNGQKMYEGEYLNGQLSGPWTHWTEAGEVQSVRSYLNGDEIRSENGK